MKCQVLFLEKKKNIISFSSADSAHSVLSVKRKENKIDRSIILLYLYGGQPIQIDIIFSIPLFHDTAIKVIFDIFFFYQSSAFNQETNYLHDVSNHPWHLTDVMTTRRLLTAAIKR